MRIRNRSLSFSALSSSVSPDLSAKPQAKHRHEEEGKEDQYEEEEEKEEKMHLNRDNKELHQSYDSLSSFLPSHEDRSPSNHDQLGQTTGRISEQEFMDGTSCMLPHQEDFATVEKRGGEEIWSASDKSLIHTNGCKNSGAQTAELLLSSQVSGARWSERESAFPLKKRKNKYEFMIVGSSEKKKSKSKRKKQRKKEEDDDDNEDDNTSGDHRVINVKKVKKNNSKSREMEGSRCSRVNGRGWRCCQATLVGYSLCEHHLGKGRLKSINNSLRQTCSSKRMGATDHKKKQFLSEPGLQEEDDFEEEEEKKPKKKKKLGGTVKARSISSLLEQIQETTGVDIREVDWDMM